MYYTVSTKKVSPQVIKTSLNKSCQCQFTAYPRSWLEVSQLRELSPEPILLLLGGWLPSLDTSSITSSYSKRSKAQFTLVKAVTVSPSDLTNHITVFTLQTIFILTQPTDGKWFYYSHAHSLVFLPAGTGKTHPHKTTILHLAGITTNSWIIIT